MTCKNSLAAIQSLLKKLIKSKTFDKNLKNVQIIHAEDGQCCAEFTIGPEHTNLFGTLHGGYSSHLIDMISTFALMTTGKEVPGASIDMHVMFLRPAKLGDKILIEANLKRGGKKIAFLDVFIKDKKSCKILVSGTHTKFKGMNIIDEINRRISHPHIFDNTLKKIILLEACNGKCSVELCVDKEHSNSRGTLHGGFSANLVDCISTYALMTYGEQVPGVSIDMHMTYMSAAKLGDEIIVEANTIRAGKSFAFLDIIIKNKKNDKIIVYGTHTKYVGK